MPAGSISIARASRAALASTSLRLSRSSSISRSTWSRPDVVSGSGGGNALEVGLFDEPRSEEHTSELQSQSNLVCRLLLEKKKKNQRDVPHIQARWSVRQRRASGHLADV